MRTARDNNIFDDDTSQSTDRVMRAYWLAPRASRAATVTALLAATPENRAPGSTSAVRFEPPR